jgi:hypothetical protein
VDVSTLLLSSEEHSNATPVEAAKPDQETQTCAEVATPLAQLGAALAAPWSEPSVQTAVVKVSSSRGLRVHLGDSPEEDQKKKWPPNKSFKQWLQSWQQLNES